MKLTPEQILKLADAHVKHFKHLLNLSTDDASFGSINTKECYDYLTLWQGIQKQEGVGLTPQQRNEVMDAAWSGDYNELLGVKERDESCD